MNREPRKKCANPKDPWLPQMPWPQHLILQWGDNKFESTSNVSDVFFEVVVNPITYIRAKGPCFAEAEIAAFTEFKQQHP